MAGAVSTTSTARVPAAGASETLDWKIVSVLLTGTFMAVLDFFIINVAIPDLQHDLSAGPAQIQLIVVGYALAYGSALIVGSRIGDVFGRRRVFLLGMLSFTASSAACGMAPAANVIVVARIAQGLSSALLSPQILSLIGTLYEGTAKARALNAYGFCMGLASVFGQVVGGLLISANLLGWGWRSCFLINVPIGVVAVVLAARIVPESRTPKGPDLDLAGMVLIASALAGVTLPLIEGREQGWPSWSWAMLAAAIALFVTFVAHERRVKRNGLHPLIDLELFGKRSFSAGLLAQLTFYTSMAGFYLVFSIYVQDGRGLSPLQAGTLFIANGVGYLISSSVARLVMKHLGRQVLTLAGLLRAIGLGLLLFVALEYRGAGLLWLVPGLFVNGLGTGFAVSPLAASVLTRMSPRHVGAASGVLTTGIQVGNAIGVAIIGIIFYDTLAISTHAQALVYSLIYLIAISLLLCAIAQALPRESDSRSA